MIPVDTFRTLGRQLLAKARAGQVVWAREEGKFTGLKERPFEYVLSWYRADRYHFAVRLVPSRQA